MFKESITIFRLWGIPIRLHFSFLLILPIIAWILGTNIKELASIAGVEKGAMGINPYVMGFILAVLLFVSVALHELTHSLVARTKGVTIHSINLMLFGGVAQMEELPENPNDEALIAFSGPLFSALFGLFLIGISVYTAGILSADIRFIGTYLGYMNIFLAIFNLIPAFPTDGGRVLRALIARRTSFLKATKIASDLGRVFAFLFGILGLLTFNIFLIFIAFFIYMGASQEYQHTLLKTTLTDFNVEDLMTSNVSAIQVDASVEELLQKMFNERHSGYPVMENGVLVGCVTMGDIQKVTPEERHIRGVRDIMSKEIKSVNPKDDIYTALKLLSRQDLGRLMVLEDEKLVGIITRSDIMKGFRLRLLEEEH